MCSHCFHYLHSSNRGFLDSSAPTYSRGSRQTTRYELLTGKGTCPFFFHDGGQRRVVLTNKSSITHVYAPPTALSQHSLTAGARLRLSSRDPVVFRVPTSQVRRSFRYHTQCSRMDSVLDSLQPAPAFQRPEENHLDSGLRGGADWVSPNGVADACRNTGPPRKARN